MISYLTIEHRGAIDNKYKHSLDDWIYGCDICQEVCPWNIKFSNNTEEKSFYIRDNIQNMTVNDWNNISESHYKKIFKKSAIKRAKYSGLVRNIKLNNN